MQFTSEQREKLKKFFQDPDWAIIQEAVGEKIVQLEMLKGIDVKESAEDVKAQVIGHMKARTILLGFFQACDIISSDASSESAKESERDFN